MMQLLYNTVSRLTLSLSTIRHAFTASPASQGPSTYNYTFKELELQCGS